MARLGETPSQTVGPFFSLRLSGEGENILAPDGMPGEQIRIEGKVLDGKDEYVEDALLELWQAHPSGRYRHPDDSRSHLDLDDGFTGFGRAVTDFETGDYWFETVKPGPVPDPEGEPQAPHLNLIIQARGMLNPLFTRIYLSDEEEANQRDLILGMVPDDRRHTLIARRQESARDGRATYRFDIRLQGDGETVFFDL